MVIFGHLTFFKSLFKQHQKLGKVVRLNGGLVIGALPIVQFLVCLINACTMPVELSSDLASNVVGVFLLNDLNVFSLIKLTKNWVFLQALEYWLKNFSKTFNFSEAFIQTLFTYVLVWIVILVKYDAVTERAYFEHCFFELRHFEQLTSNHTLAQKGYNSVELFFCEPESLIFALYVVCMKGLFL